MANDTNEITVKDNQDEQRFEAHLNGYIAIAEYRREGNEIIFTHTEVPEALEGHGVASVLVRTALDTAREQQLSVIPLCPFVAGYIRRHHEYLDIVQPEYRARLQQS